MSIRLWLRRLRFRWFPPRYPRFMRKEGERVDLRRPASSGYTERHQAKEGESMDGQLLLTVSEAADRLSLSPDTLYREMAAGRLAFVRAGRGRRIPVEALREYVLLLERDTQRGGN